MKLPDFESREKSSSRLFYIGIAGVSGDALDRFCLLGDDDWARVSELLPISCLVDQTLFGNQVVERLTKFNFSKVDAIILLNFDGFIKCEVFSVHDHQRLYLLNFSGGVRCSERFDLIFNPSDDVISKVGEVSLNQPLYYPEDTVSQSGKAEINILLGSQVESDIFYHFAYCSQHPEVDQWLPAEWVAFLKRGTVPVHTGGWEVPSWYPEECYIDHDILKCANKELLVELYDDAISVLKKFLTQGDGYVFSVDYWIKHISLAINNDLKICFGLNPLLSVVVPAYNAERTILKTINSILSQGVDSIEIIVWDDCSTDNTKKIVDGCLSDARVTYFRNSNNIGVYNNHVNAVWSASGKYLYILHGDDYLLDGHLLRLVSLLEENSQLVLAYSPIMLEVDSGEQSVQLHPGYREYDYIGGRNEVADLLVHDCYITPSATMYVRSAFRSTPFYSRNLYGAADWQLVIQMAEIYGDFGFIKQAGVVYRIHHNQQSTAFYSSNAPLSDHVCIVEGVFERGTEDRLQGRELEVADHLKRRLSIYPSERNTALGKRVQALCDKLEILSKQADRFRFTIILTTYNRPNLLRFALDSLESQEFRGFEVVLVNDGGAAVENMLAEYSFPITYICLGQNQGVAAARNIAMNVAKGENIVFLDDDDVFLSNHLQVLSSALEKKAGSVVYTDAVFVLERLNNNERVNISVESRYEHDKYSKDRLFVNNYIPVNTFCFPLRLVEDIGGFDEGLKGLEDWDFLIRLAREVEFHHVSEKTVEVRMRSVDVDPTRRSIQAASFYPDIYRTIYSRYPSSNDFIIQERNKVLQSFGVGTLRQGADIGGWLDRRNLSVRFSEFFTELDLRVYYTCFDIDLCDQSLSFPVDTSGKSVCIVSKDQLGVENLSGCEVVLAEKDCWLKSVFKDMSSSDFEWAVFLNPRSKFIDSGLSMAQIELSQNPDLSAISFDEIYRQEDDSLDAAFRPSGSLDYLLSFPAGMSRHWLFNRKALLDIGGFNSDLPDAFELDAILRLINKGGLECVGHIPEPLVITSPPLLANVDDERKAIEQHLHERGYPQAQVHAPKPGRYQIRYNHPEQPIISVILATNSSLSNLQRCVEGLLGNTSYQNFEILFIDQSDSASDVKEWLAGLAAMQEPKLRVFGSTHKALSQQYNEVQQHAIGDYLLFLSADTAIISEHWLDEMLNHAQRGEVGVVGAKLLTPAGEIAHAGYILGLEGPVGSPFVGEPMDAPGYMQRLQVDQNLSAVGGDCLMVLRELFVQLDGFANGALADDYLSTDLCLRARQAGFLIVWTPHAQLMLDKPKATGPSAEQEDVMYERWLPQLARDPAYNPNFSLAMPGGFKLADTQISWRPLDSIRPAPVALVHPADLMGCGHYRVMQPFLAMKGEGLLDGAISTGLMHVTDLERYNPDCIVLQRQIGDARLEAMQRMQKFSRAVKVYELDDYLPNLPLKSVHRKDMPKDILRSLRRGLSFVDRFVVSTHALAEAFSGLHGEIVVRENRLPLSWWGGLQTERRQGKKPRVGWAGGSSHTGDLELIADVVRDLADEVEWVFFGMCPEALKPYVHEFHGGVPIEQYPAKLASLNLDLGLAPLEHNLFNECKSNLRQLEYGVCGIPIICTDIRPYQDGLQAGLPVTLVKNRYKDWVDAIRMHINDLDATARLGDELRAKVLAEWMLEGEHLKHWRDAWLGA